MARKRGVVFLRGVDTLMHIMMSKNVFRQTIVAKISGQKYQTEENWKKKKKTLIPAFSLLIIPAAKHSFLQGRLETRLYPIFILSFS